jgi:hypothetical protein
MGVDGVKIINWGLRNRAKSGIEPFGRCGQPDTRGNQYAWRPVQGCRLI